MADDSELNPEALEYALRLRGNSTGSERSLIKNSHEPYKAMRAYHRSRTSSFYVSRLFPVLFCNFLTTFLFHVPLQLLLSGSLISQP